MTELRVSPAGVLAEWGPAHSGEEWMAVLTTRGVWWGGYGEGIYGGEGERRGKDGVVCSGMDGKCGGQGRHHYVGEGVCVVVVVKGRYWYGIM